MTALAFVMYGLGGATFDPAGGEATFVKRIAALNININASPYQWTDTQVIADAITAAPTDSKIIIGGDSLGACSTPLIAQSFLGKRTIDYIFAFQPSVYGNNVGITSNVKTARCIYNPDFIETMGLGAEEWWLADGNTVTNLLITDNYDLHPGDNDPANQDIILVDIRKVLGA